MPQCGSSDSTVASCCIHIQLFLKKEHLSIHYAYVGKWKFKFPQPTPNTVLQFFCKVFADLTNRDVQRHDTAEAVTNDIPIKNTAHCPKSSRIYKRDNMIPEIIDLHYSSHIYSMICVNLVFPIGLSHCGIDYQTMYEGWSFPNWIIPLWNRLPDYVRGLINK